MRHPITLIVLTLSVLLVAGCSGRVVTSGDYTLEGGKTLDGDLTIFSGDATLEEGSEVSGDIFMTSGNLDANGEVNGDIFLTSGNVDLGPKAVVHGDILATSGNLHRAEGSRVEGEVAMEATSFPIGSGVIVGLLGSVCAVPLFFFAMLIALIVIFARRRPASMTETATTAAATTAPAQKLGQLQEMLRSGLITEADFENKKAEILSSM